MPLKFHVEAHVRGEFIFHAGVSGDAATCCFLCFHMNDLPHSSMTGSHICIHTMCMHKSTRERNPPLGIEFFFFNFPIRNGKERSVASVTLQSSLAGFPIFYSFKGRPESPIQAHATTLLHGVSTGKNRGHLKALGMNSQRKKENFLCTTCPMLFPLLLFELFFFMWNDRVVLLTPLLLKSEPDINK